MDFTSLFNPKNTFLGTMAQSTPATIGKKQPLVPAPKPAVDTAIASNGATSPAPAPKPSPEKAKFVQNLASTSGSSVATPAPTAPTTPPTNNPNPPVPNYKEPTAEDQYRSSYEKYLQTLTMSPEEIAAQKELNRLTSQAEQDQETALDRGETLGFATGEAARVAKNNNLAINAATRNLTALTGIRSANTEAVKARLDFEKSLMDSDMKKADQALALKKFDRDIAESDRKFEEDKRQFGLEYALKARETAVAEAKAATDNAAKAGASNDANALKTNALTTANALLDKFTKGEGTSAVGKSNFLGSLGYGLLPGTKRADFIVDYNNLKSLLSLENVKYLKGQGAVSDAERALLEKASSKLDRSQSEEAFKSALNDIISVLGGTADTGEQALRDAGYSEQQIQDIKNAK